jgi:hypothetical protein
MPDRERELERKLRELGSLIDYPPTPDVARATRNVLDEQSNARPRRFRVALPTLRWAAVAFVLVVVAVPTLSPGMRATVGDWFVAKDIQSANGSAVGSGPAERQQEANAPASGVSKSGASATRTPRFSEERITLREARARMKGALLLPQTPKLGQPDEIYADGTSRQDGVVLVYRAGLPPLGNTEISLILTEVPGDTEPAYLAGEIAVRSRLDRVSVNGGSGYWSPAGRRLPSPVERHLLGNVLLWEKGGVALRLEANLPKEQAVHIAESVR